LKRIRALVCLMAAICVFICGAGAEGDMSLTVTATSRTGFTNSVPHYVYFNVEAENADYFTLRVYNPDGERVSFTTYEKVKKGQSAVNDMTLSLRNGRTGYEGLNVLFKSDIALGTWVIEVTAANAKKEKVVETLNIEVTEVGALELEQLSETREMVIGTEDNLYTAVEEGKYRYVSQDPDSKYFVKEYWMDPKFDLRDSAKQKCTRALFSTVLSGFGIDLTPVEMSGMVGSRGLSANFDEVCAALGNVRRTEGDLETLWARYTAGEASPPMLHFVMKEGMHAVLLLNRDRENPDLYYALTTGQTANLTGYVGGLRYDYIIPILIEHGEVGTRIHSPAITRYDKGTIDWIYQWEIFDDN